MAVQALTRVVLAVGDEVLLRRMAMARTTSAAVATRARVLLARHEGASLQACARQAHCSRSTAYRVCRRFQGRRLDALWETLRPGTPLRHSAQVRDFFCTLVRQAPDQAGLPISRWSLRWLQVAARRAGHKKPPSRETLRRWLHEAHLAWHRHRSWQTSNDPHFWAKLERLRTLYDNTDPKLLVLAFDEKPQIQALDKRVPDRLPIRGHPRKRQHDYIRRGTFTLCAIQRLRDGKVQITPCSRHTAATTGAILARYLRRRPERRVAIILDNLSVHSAPAFRQALASTGKEIELAPTPTYASWANSAEWYLNHLQRDLLKLATVSSVPELIALAKRYTQLYNRECAAPVRMPGLGRFIHRVRTSKTRH